MKKLLALGLLMGSLNSQTAFAEIRTFDYLAKITAPGVSVPGLVEGSTVSHNDLIKGRFSFDDQGFDNNHLSWGPHRGISLSATFLHDGTTVTALATSWSINPPDSALSFAIGSRRLTTSSPGDAYVGLSFSLLDPFLQPRPDLFDFENDPRNGGFTIGWQTENGQVNLGGQVIWIDEVEVSPVPEPSTYGMLLLGAGVVAGAAKRKQRKAAA